jgi:hypothetical protein
MASRAVLYIFAAFRKHVIPTLDGGMAGNALHSTKSIYAF